MQLYLSNITATCCCMLDNVMLHVPAVKVVSSKHIWHFQRTIRWSLQKWNLSLKYGIPIVSKIQGGPKKWHKVNDTIILQPYVIESCGFQQNVSKEILYVTKVIIWIQQLNIFCYSRWQLNYAETVLPLTLQFIKMYHFYFFNSSVKHWLIFIIFGMWH